MIESIFGIPKIVNLRWYLPCRVLPTLRLTPLQCCNHLGHLNFLEALFEIKTLPPLRANDDFEVCFSPSSSPPNGNCYYYVEKNGSFYIVDSTQMLILVNNDSCGLADTAIIEICRFTNKITGLEGWLWVEQ